jgi:hypothetical protein
MPRHQFEADLIHLEQIVPFLNRESSPGILYWRGRVASLSKYQSLVPDGAIRVKRLLRSFDDVERAAASSKPVVSR